ncbi:membrane protein [Pseudomonas flexibilis]|uniref:Integrating conjugative element membrane protein, PFL_4697 family n=1 Tax=Pseudomonas flexibilis TaxID=706570 RepID=A0A1N7AFG4_9PSED|nr:TIGR03747 family integrating conjugative element membrane protein [Pseudomonas flexibilis]KHL69376.1 membrane protein [Pseudomonas flexibilis]SIR37711.1 integrating conjugative element membrane protein, PFL_4697 family [Pseudomonas flexibilis]
MAAQGSTVQPPQRQTLLGQLLSLPGRILGLLLVSLLCSLLMEYAGMLWFWPEEGWQHSQAMLHAELGWLGEQFPRSLLLQDPDASTRVTLDWLHTTLFERSGLLDYASQARANHHERNLTGLLAQLYLLIEDFVLASLFVTLTFAVRLIILTLALPLFALAMLSGLVDGLVRRDLRKFGAGRESSFIYHRAKRLILPTISAPWLLYLALPVSLHPMWVLLPSAGLLGVAVAITAGTFKKYL